MAPRENVHRTKWASGQNQASREQSRLNLPTLSLPLACQLKGAREPSARLRHRAHTRARLPAIMSASLQLTNELLLFDLLLCSNSTSLDQTRFDSTRLDLTWCRFVQITKKSNYSSSSMKWPRHKRRQVDLFARLVSLSLSLTQLLCREKNIWLARQRRLKN